MSNPSPDQLPNSSDPSPQIQQESKGNSNQIIGQMLGGMVVYGQVIYNNAVVEKSEATEIGPNPYKGLLAFHETDGNRFFGRDSQIAELWEKFRRLHEDDSATRLLTIYGPSGSGKSSLARAGLIPALAKRPLPGCDRARVAVLVPGSHPLEALATVLARVATEDATPVAKTREFAAELKEANSEGIYDGLRRIADALPEIAVSPLIVVVDQLEEVFTLCEDATEQEAFVGNLLCATGERSKRVSAIVTIRSDFLGATQQHLRLNQLIASQGFFVAAMSPEGLREAISKPAEKAGHALDSSTVDRLIEQTEGREGALPLLQFALTRIWAGLAEGKEPAQTLKEIGGVGGALAGEAQRIYEGLSVEEKKIARRIFLGLVQLGEGAKDTRRRTKLERVVSHQDSFEQVQKVIGRFSAPGVRLITLAEDGGTQTAEVTHEALFEHWQQMKVWLDGGRSDLRFQRRLDEAAMIWQQNGQPEGSLWRPPDLDLLRQYNARSGDDMTPMQVKFLNASVNATEKAEKERKRQRRLLTGVLSIGLAFTSGASIIALYQLQQAQRQRAEQLAANAEVLLASQPVSATINAIAATGLSQSAFVQFPTQPQFGRVEGSLLNVIRENPERIQLLHEGVVRSVVFSPDGKRIISGSDDGTVRVWDASTGVPIGEPFKGHKERVNSVAFSSDSKQIASGSSDDTVRVWNVSTGEPTGKMSGAGQVRSVAFSPDGKRIVSGSSYGTMQIWDVNTGEPRFPSLQGHTDTVTSVAFSPDGKQLVSGSMDTTIRVWNASTGELIGRPFKGHEPFVSSVAFSPDGKRIVSGGGDHTVRVWNASTRVPIGKPFEGHEHSVRSAKFSPDGERIVSGSNDGTVRVWNARTGEPIGKTFKENEDFVTSVAFSPDGRRVVSGSNDGTVRVWDTSAEELSDKLFKGHKAYINSVKFSPDGKRIVSGSDDGTVWVWDASTGVPIGKPFEGHKGGDTSVASSPDGKRIVRVSNDGTVRVWNTRTGEPIGKPFKGSKGGFDSVVVAFSLDGKRIVSGNRDKIVQVWDASTGDPIGNLVMKHEASVNSVSFSPDSQRIISGGGDSVQVWDARTGEPIGKPFKRHDSFVTSVAFSPDGRRVVSGSGVYWATSDYTVQVWDISWEKALQVACQKLRYHPSLSKPTTDVAREAKQTCERYAWK